MLLPKIDIAHSRKITVGLLFLAAVFLMKGNCFGQQFPQQYSFSQQMADYTLVDGNIRYDENHPFGVDLNTSLTANKPFYFSTKASEGNYRVTMQVRGNENTSGKFTVKAESRRLMLLNVALQAGESMTESFLVNIKDRHIAGGGTVSLKTRELDKLDWDDKLTIEFDGQNCSLQILTITKLQETIPTLYLAGNSTVVNQDQEPWASWGQMITAFFQPTMVVANHAESGLSLGSFLGSKRLDKVLSLLKPKDYLFIEFGHNDQKEKGPKDGPYGSYTERLKYYIDAVRAKGGIPVIVTSTHRRTFDESGRLMNSLGDYPDAARKVANALQVPLIDLNQMTKVLYETLGPEGSKKAFVHYPANSFPGQKEDLADDTHFNTYGAYQIAQCVLSGIQKELPALAAYVKKGVAMYDPTAPDAFTTWNWTESPRTDSTKPDGN